MKVQSINNPNIDLPKVQKVYGDLVKVFQKNKLTVQEILLVLGNLTYTLGASIGGYKDKGPSQEVLEEKYILKPTIDVSLMLSGLNFTAWVPNLDKKIEELVEELKKK